MEVGFKEGDVDQILRVAIEEADKAMGEPREPGRRFGACGLASDLVRRSAELQGISAETRQLLYVHRDLGGMENAFQHGFNILSIGGKRLLVDVSFVQFIDPQTQEIYQGINTEGRPRHPISGKLDEHPVAQSLLRDGYAELNDDSFKEYLRVTTSAVDKSYIEAATVEKLIADPSSIMPYDHTLVWLDQRLGRSSVL